MFTTFKKLSFLLICSILCFSCAKKESEKGMAFYQSKEYDKAIAMFDTYLTTHPKDAKTHFNKGRALEEKGDLALALKSYQKAVKFDNTEANFWLASGMCNFKMKNFENTVSNMDGLLGLQSKNGEAMVLKARAFAQMKKMRSALETLNKAISTNQRNGNAYFYRGYIRAVNRDVNACNDLEQAKRLNVKQAQEFLNKYCE